ncbi:MAG: small multi-drug export protein [Oscillospiraceae bacterium]|nr:small multi-drug export protein [Oscillospiraceae bacterium]
MTKYIIAFLISMVPIVELRGGVPYAMAAGLDRVPAVFMCAVANLLPVPVVYMFARKFLLWGAKQKHIGKFCGFFLEKGEKAGRKLTKSTGRFGSFIALMLFVGIPLPGTGAWTGTLAASLLNLGPKTTAGAVTLGVMIAGCIMAFASAGVLHIFGM